MSLFQIEIDIIGTDGYEERTREYARKFDCTAEVITHDGPAGGNPLYRIIGKKEDLIRLFKNYCRQAYEPNVNEGTPGRPRGGTQVDAFVVEDVQELFNPEPFTLTCDGQCEPMCSWCNARADEAAEERRE